MTRNRQPKRKGIPTLLIYTAFAALMALSVAGYWAARRYAANPEESAPPVAVQAAPIKQPATAEPADTAPAAFAAQIKALGKGFDGEVGIAVQSIELGWHAAYGGDHKFPQQSVSKLWVAATVMDKIDRGELALDDTIPLTAKDLTIFHQPIRKNILAEGTYNAPISKLLYFAMTQSDNTANDALFRRVGGKAGVEGFLQSKGLNAIAMSEGEKELQMAISGMRWQDSFSYGRIFWQVREGVPIEVRAKAINAYVADPADGASPLAITAALARLYKGDLVSGRSSAYLIDLMNQSITGPDRLRGGLSPGWSLAHKTGTGQVLKALGTAYNDVGILTSLAGKHYTVAVMIGATSRPVPERQALMHGVMQSIAACETNGWQSCS